MANKKSILAVEIIALVILVSLVVNKYVSSRVAGEQEQEEAQQEEVITYTFDINPEGYSVERGTIASGQTLSTILGPYGVGAAMIDKISKAAEPVYSLRNMRAGNDFVVYITQDSLARVEHFVYEKSAVDYFVIDILDGDSVSVALKERPIVQMRRTGEGVISSSLWNCMMDNDMSPALAMDMSDIYAWSIDFFGLQKEDSFRIIYDEKYVDSTRVGTGRIWGMEFIHSGKTYYAIPFEQGGKITYWDEQGNSLRKNLLKAPLKYSRISSTFSHSRLHPVLKIRRPHLGVDYAAPSGTPVVAVADGVVISKGYAGGGGNTVKIRHASNLMSGYLHLKGYADGIYEGAHVDQGQVIGYVGSTGMSTGPHLDFRLWQGGTPIDPLKAPTEPTEPISEENRADFEMIRDLILAELRGEPLADSMIVTQLDSLDLYKSVIGE